MMNRIVSVLLHLEMRMFSTTLLSKANEEVIEVDMVKLTKIKVDVVTMELKL